MIARRTHSGRLVMLLPAIGLFATTLHGQAATASPHWSELLVTGAERVEIDRGSIQAGAGNLRTVWLRWNLSRGTTAGVKVYTIEQAELDCASVRGRVLHSRREMVDDTGRHRDVPNADADSSRTWHAYPAGSLGAHAWRAACQARAS